MTQKKRELMTKVATNDGDDEVVTSDDEDVAVKNGDEKAFAVNVDVLLSEEKNPWIGQNNNDSNEIDMKQKMAKLLKGIEQKSEKELSARAEVNPIDFGFVKEKRLLKVNDDNDDEDDEVSEDEEKRQQVKKNHNLNLFIKLLLNVFFYLVLTVLSMFKTLNP
jgi:hypothetical protein